MTTKINHADKAHAHFAAATDEWSKARIAWSTNETLARECEISAVSNLLKGVAHQMVASFQSALHIA